MTIQWKMVLAALILPGVALPSLAASRAEMHMAVYSAGFLVDTQRQETYGDKARRVQIKTTTKGIAKGETPDSSIEIDRVDQGLQWQLDPQAKTYREEAYLPAVKEKGASPSAPSTETPTLKISKIDPKISGPLGSDTINGLACKSYTIRIVADFTSPQTGKVVATETLLEKLWVTEKAPEIVAFRKAEGQFHDALTHASYETEKATFRWLLREFNRQILETNGNMDDFQSLLVTYQGARASIKGVTVRQLAGWNWRPKDPSAPGAGEDMHAFIASIATGLGAPDSEGKTPLADSEKPKWVLELQKDLGRTGSSAMLLEEILKAHSAQVSGDFFEVPAEYKKL